MTQMSLSMIYRIMDIENRLVVAKREGAGEGWSGSLGLAVVSYYIENG